MVQPIQYVSPEQCHFHHHLSQSWQLSVLSVAIQTDLTSLTCLASSLDSDPLSRAWCRTICSIKQQDLLKTNVVQAMPACPPCPSRTELNLRAKIGPWQHFESMSRLIQHAEGQLTIATRFPENWGANTSRFSCLLFWSLRFMWSTGAISFKHACQRLLAVGLMIGEWWQWVEQGNTMNTFNATGWQIIQIYSNQKMQKMKIASTVSSDSELDEDPATSKNPSESQFKTNGLQTLKSLQSL